MIALARAVSRYTLVSAPRRAPRSVNRRVPSRFIASNVPTRCDSVKRGSPRWPRFVVMTTTPFVAREP
jgi:hypothetical protein